MGRILLDIPIRVMEFRETIFSLFCWRQKSVWPFGPSCHATRQGHHLHSERQEIRTEKSLRMTKRISKKFSKFPQHLPPNVWNADVQRVLEQVGVAVTPTWHLPKTYLNTYLRNEGQKMVVTIVWEKCRFSPREMSFLSQKSGTSPYSKCHFAVLKVPFSLPKHAT